MSWRTRCGVVHTTRRSAWGCRLECPSLRRDRTDRWPSAHWVVARSSRPPSFGWVLPCTILRYITLLFDSLWDFMSMFEPHPHSAGIGVLEFEPRIIATRKDPRQWSRPPAGTAAADTAPESLCLGLNCGVGACRSYIWVIWSKLAKREPKWPRHWRLVFSRLSHRFGQCGAISYFFNPILGGPARLDLSSFLGAVRLCFYLFSALTFQHYTSLGGAQWIHHRHLHPRRQPQEFCALAPVQELQGFWIGAWQISSLILPRSSCSC